MTRCMWLLDTIRRPSLRARPAAASVLRPAGVVAGVALLMPIGGFAAEPAHCLTGAEERTAIASGKAIAFAAVVRTLHRAPKDIIGARLCREGDRLIYLLTLLGRDGKVRRATLDAASGAVVGER
jgi:hypothetical protein